MPSACKRKNLSPQLTEEQQKSGLSSQLVGLVLEGRGVMRAGQRVRTDAGEGLITSGGFSPTMEKSIALARLPVNAAGTVEIEIRKNLVPARVVRPPFVKHGRILVNEGEQQ